MVKCGVRKAEHHFITDIFFPIFATRETLCLVYDNLQSEITPRSFVSSICSYLLNSYTVALYQIQLGSRAHGVICTKYISLNVGAYVYIVISLHGHTGFLRESGRLLVKTEKGKRPSELPCGIPHFLSSKKLPLKKKNTVKSEIKDMANRSDNMVCCHP